MVRPKPEKKNIAQPLQRGFVGDKLHDELSQFIASASPHQAIASERKLAAQYGLGFMTARKIIDRLVEKKLLYRIHGKGTFVAEQPSRKNRNSKTILYVDDWGQSDHPYCMRRLRGILDGAEASGLRVQVHTCPDFSERGMDAIYLNEIERPDVVGILIPRVSDPLYAEMKRRNKELQIVAATSSALKKDMSAVQGNPFSMGYQAAQYLCKRGAKKLLIVYKYLEVLNGADAGSRETARAMELSSIAWNPSEDVQPVCEKIIKLRPQGLAMDDDRQALAVLKSLERLAPDLIRSMHIISCANVGDDILPPEIARLTLDGYEMGMVAISVLKAMIEGKSAAQTVIQIDPKLVEPVAITHF